jgi:hypothetical protein
MRISTSTKLQLHHAANDLNDIRLQQILKNHPIFLAAVNQPPLETLNGNKRIE